MSANLSKPWSEDLGTDEPRRRTLGDLDEKGPLSGVSVTALVGRNLGNRTVSFVMTMGEFRRLSDIANRGRLALMAGGDDPAQVEQLMAQRPLSKDHAKKLAIYSLKGLVNGLIRTYEGRKKTVPADLARIGKELGLGPYQSLQPIVCNLRKCAWGGADLEFDELGAGLVVLKLRKDQIFWVVDGQHRREAFKILLDWLDEMIRLGRYVKRGLYIPENRSDDDLEMSSDEAAVWDEVALMANEFTIDVTSHLGLDVVAERQLFHDLNNLVKKPEPTMMHGFDTANAVGQYIRDHLEDLTLIAPVTILKTGSKKGGKKRDLDEPRLYLDDVMAECGMMFGGNKSPTKIEAQEVRPFTLLADRFWRAIARQPHWGAPGWSKKTLLAQPVVIKALALLFGTWHVGREANKDTLNRFLKALEDQAVDFSPANPLWHLYFKSDAERDQADPMAGNYLTPDEIRGPYATERDGQLDFGSNTRDISRYLGDLIRLKLRLPFRPGLQELKDRLRDEPQRPHLCEPPKDQGGLNV